MKTKKDVLISVIIPIYNRGFCLACCLDSVLNQTFTSWECILIDDGSTDDTLSVCRRYAGKDSRFRIFSQPNKGVSDARNHGLEQAQGKYIAFIDSDDWVDDNYLQLLYESVNEDDMLPFCGLQPEGMDCMNLSVKSDRLYLLDNEVTDLLIDHFISGDLLRGPVGKLYNRSVIEKHRIRFPLGIDCGEDTIFNFVYLRYINKVKGVPYFLYHVVRRGESLSVSARYNNFLTDSNLRIYDSIFGFVKAKDIDDPVVKNHIDDMYVTMVFQTLAGILHVHDRLSWKERYKQMEWLMSQVDRGKFKKYLFKSFGSAYKAFAVYFRIPVLLFSFYEIKYLFLPLKNN